MYKDLFLYDVGGRKWTKVCIPGGPQARSAHQAIYYKGFMYIFGGEYTSPNQTKVREVVWFFQSMYTHVDCGLC